MHSDMGPVHVPTPSPWAAHLSGALHVGFTPFCVPSTLNKLGGAVQS